MNEFLITNGQGNARRSDGDADPTPSPVTRGNNYKTIHRNHRIFPLTLLTLLSSLLPPFPPPLTLLHPPRHGDSLPHQGFRLLVCLRILGRDVRKALGPEAERRRRTIKARRAGTHRGEGGGGGEGPGEAGGRPRGPNIPSKSGSRLRFSPSSSPPRIHLHPKMESFSIESNHKETKMAQPSPIRRRKKGRVTRASFPPARAPSRDSVVQ